MRKESPGLARQSDKALAALIKEKGATRRHAATGSLWTLPSVREARETFERQFGAWEWDTELESLRNNVREIASSSSFIF